MLGVVDDGDPLSDNTLVSLVATPLAAIPFDPDQADFDQDTDIDGSDYLAWLRGFAVATLAGLNDGDGNHDGAVTGADLAIWKSLYGTTAPVAALLAVPEPTTWALMLLAGMSSLALRRAGGTRPSDVLLTV